MQKSNEIEMKSREMMNQYKAKNYQNALFLGDEILGREPKKTSVLYIAGLASSMIEMHEKTVDYFTKLINLEPKYKKNVYLFLSIAYKKLGENTKAVRVLDSALHHFPLFNEANVRAFFIKFFL